MILYHTTDAAGAILGSGFRDAEGSYMFVGLTLRGVFLSITRPMSTMVPRVSRFLRWPPSPMTWI